MPRQPPVPTDALDAGGWREVERGETTAFDARVVRVEAATVVFEDARLRERVRAATGLDYPWRFFVAGRLELRPAVPASRGLTALVAGRAHAGFAERLAERGLSGVRRISGPGGRGADDGRTDGAERPDGTDAVGAATRLAGCDGLYRLDAASVRVRGWVGVAPDAESFVLGGGAYPAGVRDAATAELREGLAGAFDPATFEAELFGLIRATTGGE